MSLHGHPSPELIYDAVRKKSRSISLATVYKNVRTFLESGMLREVSIHHGSLRVEPNETSTIIWSAPVQTDHRSGSGEPGARPRQRSGLRRDFQVTRITVDVLGMCELALPKRVQNRVQNDVHFKLNGDNHQFANVNSFFGGSARSVLRGALSVKWFCISSQSFIS